MISFGGAVCEITSYGNFAERIVIRNPDSKSSIQKSESKGYSTSESAHEIVPQRMRVTSRRQQEILARARQQQLMPLNSDIIEAKSEVSSHDIAHDTVFSTACTGNNPLAKQQNIFQFP